jgi:hypothetical protein
MTEKYYKFILKYKFKKIKWISNDFWKEDEIKENPR